MKIIFYFDMFVGDWYQAKIIKIDGKRHEKNLNRKNKMCFKF